MQDQKNILLELAKSYGQKVRLILVDEHYFNDAPASLGWPKETYYRLLLNEYLPKEWDRVLYLDCDTIINKPIDSLYDADFNNNYLAAVEDIAMVKWGTIKKQRIRLGLDVDRSYFNAGVLLFDLTKSRAIISYGKAREIIGDLGKNLAFLEQDIINVVFDNKIESIDIKYNNFYVLNFKYNKISRLFNHEDKKMLDETFIFHFVVKPWVNSYTGCCEEIWYKYLKISPYKDLYFNKFSKFKYKILRTGIMKTFFEKYISLSPLGNKVVYKIFPEKISKLITEFYRKSVS